MRVLLTGADGYIGAIMGPKLIAAGHDVIGLDTGFYRRGWLFDDNATHPKVVSKDLRCVTAEDLAGFDAVVHLSELSNDPLGENDPELTMAINHRGSVALAEKARAAGVSRFIYASSCSTYGAGGDEMRTEESALAPQTAYARCKILVERDVKALTDETFTPVFMRNATAYGASPRQRFDLVLNNLCGFAHTTGEIRMTSDGSASSFIASRSSAIERARSEAVESSGDDPAKRAESISLSTNQRKRSSSFLVRRKRANSRRCRASLPKVAAASTA